MIQHILRKAIAFMIVFTLVFGIVPWQDIRSYAYDPDNYFINEVVVTKIYAEGGYTVRNTIVTIVGNHLKDINAGTITGAAYNAFTRRTHNLESIQEFVVDGGIVGNAILVGNVYIPIDQQELPTISGVDKRSVRLGSDSLTIRGSFLQKMRDFPTEYTAYYENSLGGGGQIIIPPATFDNNTQVTIPSLNGVAGLQDIVFRKRNTIQVDFDNNTLPRPRNVTVTIQNTYQRQFRLIDSITVDNLVMSPNRGQPGDTITFTATNGLDNYDVFFVKNLTDIYTNDNKGRNTSNITYIDENINGTIVRKQVLTTQVPDFKLGVIEKGEYFVVLTNRIPPGANPNDEINKQLVLGTAPNYEKFTIIDAEQKIKVFSIHPNRGPDTGSKAELVGTYFGTLNIPEFIPRDSVRKVGTLANSDDTVLEITYGDEEHQGINVGTYKGYTVTSAKRTMRVVIGGIARFARKTVPNPEDPFEYSFTRDMDKVSIITPSVSDAETNPIKDVIVETETTLKLEGFPNNVVIRDRAELRNAYTYIASKVTPTITSVTPEKIHFTMSAANVFELSEDRMIAINGSNFFVHKYTREDGTEEIRYPIVEIGRDLRFNKNSNLADSNPNIQLKVLNSSGLEVDGSVGNEIGNTILIIMPKEETKVFQLGKTFVRVINPVRNSDAEGFFRQQNDIVEFTTTIDPPIIENVEPNIVTVEGGQDIVVTGSNFQEGARVFINGQEVVGVTREISQQGNKHLLKFKAPRGQEGTTQLQVMNRDGGIAVIGFTYVRSFNKDPVINNFSPNRGGNGTLVVVNGDNFLRPDPTTVVTTGIGIHRLIGTRILLDNREINSYNRVGNNIVLRGYAAPVGENIEKYKLLYKENNRVMAAEYAHSVILRENGRFYVIEVDTRGDIVLSDGAANQYAVTRPHQTEPDTFIATKDGREYNIVYRAGSSSDDPDQLIISDGIDPDKILDITTPYTTEYSTEDGVTGNIITGNRVRIINRNQLIFTVPRLENFDKWYDVTVINPDTRSHTRAGQQGFFYFSNPRRRPVIEQIIPTQGSVDGGYLAEIRGSDFEDNGTTKTRVFIGGVEVSPIDVVISPDRRGIVFRVPRYPGNLIEEVETGRKTVPVVVVNPDGGNASKVDGFTYIIPTSHPTITALMPARGSAAGGNIIQIRGTDFRFYEPYKDENGNSRFDEGTETFQDINGDGSWTYLGEGMVQDLERESDKLILPSIYFGGRLANIIEYRENFFFVEVPAGARGTVDVYVVNNDFGISNRVRYTYESTNPVVTSIVPNVGRKQGNDKIEINGRGFERSRLEIYNNLTDADGNTLYDIRNMALIRFGDTKNPLLSNREIKPEDENGGRIIGGSARVRLDNLTVDYNATQKTLLLTLEDRGKLYTKTIRGYDNTVKYFTLDAMLNGSDIFNSFEMVQVSVDLQTSKLMVERGYAPYHINQQFSQTQLTFYTPAYYTIGRVPVTIINPDLGQARTEFEYKNPDSMPRISNITKEGRMPVVIGGVRVVEVTHKGGNIISVLGSDFRDRARIQISNVVAIEPDKIQYDSLPGKLTFTMPAVPETAVGQLHRVIVINEDGGTASSDLALPTAVYIKFIKGETNPTIEKVTPDRGPSSGGTRVVITGNDFRQIDGEIPTVFFGEVQATNVTLVDYKTIIAITPSHPPRKVNVKIENPDGELANPEGTFTYLSTPKILAVVDPADPNENARISSISVEGDQLIKLKGSSFMAGARVMFGSTLKPLANGAAPKGEVVYIEGQPHDLEGGKAGSAVTFIDDETLTVKTPAGKLDTRGVIVVNTDGGASNIYEDLKYGLPELAAPTDVVAELVYDRYIKIHWQGVTDAKAYEIYTLEGSSTSREYIGTTELTSFVFHDLKPNTNYRFIVTALGNFGNSPPSIISNLVRTGRRVGSPDDDGSLNENTKMEKIGTRAIVAIGTKDANKELTFDLTKGDLAGSQDIVISIPASIIAGADTKNVTIIGRDFRIRMNPNVFYSTKIKDNRNKTDAGVRFTIAPTSTDSIGTGNTALSTQYELSADLYIGNENSALDFLGSSFQITLDVNLALTDLRRFRTIGLSRYQGEEQAWRTIASGNQDSVALTALADRLGKFGVIGRRR